MVKIELTSEQHVLQIVIRKKDINCNYAETLFIISVSQIDRYFLFECEIYFEKLKFGHNHENN